MTATARPLALAAAVCTGALAVVPAHAASTNVLPTAVVSATSTGVTGMLRAGTIWTTPTASLPASVYDNSFAAEGTQWNNGSFWWDNDSSVNALPVYLTLALDKAYTFDRFTVQADDNDSYLIEAWDAGSSSWVTAVNVGPQYSYGLVTRPDFNLFTPITTDALRITGFGGDAYYSVSEVQGYAQAVPEPSTYALLAAGLGMLGAMRRRRAGR